MLLLRGLEVEEVHGWMVSDVPQSAEAEVGSDTLVVVVVVKVNASVMVGAEDW